MQTDSVINAMMPALAALVTLLVAVVGGFSLLVNRMRIEINRVDGELKEARGDAESRRKAQQVTEDALHDMTRQVATLQSERDELVKRLDTMTQQVTELASRYSALDERMHELRDKMESDRIFAQGKIDAERGGREKAEKEALMLRADIKTLAAQKDALEQRLEDQAQRHKAQIDSLNERAARMEAQYKLLSMEIDSRISTATYHLREQVQALIGERERLETRVHDLEKQGETHARQVDGRGTDGDVAAAHGGAGDGAGAAADQHGAPRADD